MATENLQQLYR